ncbi:MAG: tryptophan synthase subunit alpha, partial [Ruminococcus sp.]
MTENRIDRTLQALKQQGKKALIPFVTAGHGGYDRTEQLVLQMEKAGADIIELGVPFSDPIAEGPVIQHASEQALKQGTTLAGIFELVKRLRKKTDMPLLLMMYLNTIFSHGTEEFFRTC